MSVATPTAPAAAPFAADLGLQVRRILTGAAAGGLAGLLVGGVGGRLAMLLLRVTSSENLHGMNTDDGFAIGQITLGGSLLLLLATTGIGATAGILYGVFRPYLPAWRVPLAALTGGLVGGAMIIHPDGVDFRFLDPLPLAMALFVLLPAAGAVLTVRLADRYLASPWWFDDRRRTALALAPALALAFVPPVPVAGFLLALMATLARRQGVEGDRRLRAGLTAIVLAICVASAVGLAGDVADIL